MDTKLQIDSSDNAGGKIKVKDDVQPDITILCFDIGHLNRTSQFLVCCFGVFLFYLIYGYLQELIFTLDGFKPYGWYLTLVQFGYYSVFGFIETLYQNPSPRRIPIKTYLLLALLTLGTMGFSNSSVGYLNYPTQVMFKCCKLIPVMIGSIVIQQKRYGPIDFLAVGCMCLGLASFTLVDSQVSPNFNTVGVVMISCALLCDAIIGNVQEKSMKSHKATNTEVVLYSYSIGFVYLFITMLITGGLQDGIKFCSKHPKETYGYGMLFSITGYLGIQIVLTLVQMYGALIAVTVTTCRKAVTIIMSFVFFSKPFSIQYVWSGLLVVFGIYLNVYSKNQNQINIQGYLRKLKQLIGRTSVPIEKFSTDV